MQLYKTTYQLSHNDGGKTTVTYGRSAWHSSEADAGKFRAATRKDFKGSNPTTVAVDVVPNKAGILALLNGPYCF